MEETIAKVRVEAFLMRNGWKMIYQARDMDVWAKDGDTTFIQLPMGWARIDLEIFEDIALHQVGVNIWDIDIEF